MIVKDLFQIKEFKVINQGNNLETVISKPFCCDLLSIAVGKMTEGAAWVTVMANINTLGVASLKEASCIILAEGAAFDEPALKKAETEGITVFSSDFPVFESALLIQNL